MRIAMIGAGYVGLVSSACLADFGHHVVCVDTNEQKIAALEARQMPIYEPGLESLVIRNMDEGRLSFASELSGAVAQAEVVFIAVGTPSRRGDGHADLTYVFAAAEEIAAAMDGFTVVVTKSTVPVGTSDEVEQRIRAKRPDAEFAVVSNPEFLREGAAIGDFKRPDRIVIGVHDERAEDVIREVYRPLYLNETPIVFTSRRSAEMIKYAANAFLAMKITFINEIADLCEKVGSDVQDVAGGLGLDKRIGAKFLNAGPGFGGSCFPKDITALAQTAVQAGAPLTLVEAVIAANQGRKKAMAERIITACGGDVNNKRIAVLGLTFKPNTDDMRDSASLEIIPALIRAGAEISCYDPQGMEEAKRFLPDLDIAYAADAYQAMEGADAVVIVTEWDPFRALDFDRMKTLLKKPVLIDLRNIYDAQQMKELDFEYHGIGKPHD